MLFFLISCLTVLRFFTDFEILFSFSSPESHVPVSLSYHLSDMFFDLLNFAAETLVLGGRLVYWLPVYTPEYVMLTNFIFNFTFVMVFVNLTFFPYF